MRVNEHLICIFPSKRVLKGQRTLLNFNMEIVTVPSNGTTTKGYCVVLTFRVSWVNNIGSLLKHI